MSYNRHGGITVGDMETWRRYQKLLFVLLLYMCAIEGKANVLSVNMHKGGHVWLIYLQGLQRIEKYFSENFLPPNSKLYQFAFRVLGFPGMPQGN